MAMLANGEADVGVVRVRKTLELKPDLLTGLTPFVWLLAAHPEPGARRPADARTLAEQIVSATSGRDPAALDALAACHAALGSFEDAVRLASAAEVATRASPPAMREAIRARIALYRAGHAFTLPR